jgi:hypothetical protein
MRRNPPCSNDDHGGYVPSSDENATRRSGLLAAPMTAFRPKSRRCETCARVGADSSVPAHKMTDTTCMKGLGACIGGRSIDS